MEKDTIGEEADVRKSVGQEGVPSVFAHVEPFEGEVFHHEGLRDELQFPGALDIITSTNIPVLISINLVTG